MRTPTLGLTLATLLAVSSLACQGDPADPMTWAKQLKDLRTQKEALDNLAKMDVEKARPAVPALIELYQDDKRPEHLEALARYKDPATKPLLIEALDFSDDDFDRATIAAGVLADMKAADAVDPLMKAASRPLPIKSRANSARIAALRALVKIGDKRAVPTLMKLLTTSADEQDFLLNQKAALGLAELRDGLPQGRQVGLVPARRREPGRVRLQRDPEVDDVVELAGLGAHPHAPLLQRLGQLGHVGAAERSPADLHVAVLLQDLDRLAQADPGHPELLRQVALGRQPVPGADLTPMDQRPQVLGDGLRQ